MTIKAANEEFMKNKGAFAKSVFKGLGNNVHLKRVEEWENIADDYKTALQQLLDLNKRYFKEPVPENLSPNDLQSWMASRLGRNTGLRRENYDNEKEELELVIGMKAAKLQKALEKIKPDDVKSSIVQRIAESLQGIWDISLKVFNTLLPGDKIKNMVSAVGNGIVNWRSTIASAGIAVSSWFFNPVGKKSDQELMAEVSKKRNNVLNKYFDEAHYTPTMINALKKYNGSKLLKGRAKLSGRFGDKLRAKGREAKERIILVNAMNVGDVISYVAPPGTPSYLGGRWAIGELIEKHKSSFNVKNKDNGQVQTITIGDLNPNLWVARQVIHAYLMGITLKAAAEKGFVQGGELIAAATPAAKEYYDALVSHLNPDKWLAAYEKVQTKIDSTDSNIPGTPQALAPNSPKASDPVSNNAEVNVLLKQYDSASGDAAQIIGEKLVVKLRALGREKEADDWDARLSL